MQFIHRLKITEAPFNLQLTDVELWDLVVSGRLQPFAKAPRRIAYGPPDQLSGDYDYDPIFPPPIDKKYERLSKLRYLIRELRKFLAKSDDEHWQGFVDGCKRRGDKIPEDPTKFHEHTDSVLEESHRELDEYRPEAEALEAEFSDIARLYSDIEWSARGQENFLDGLNDAFFRRDQIETVKSQRDQPAETSNLEAKPPRVSQAGIRWAKARANAADKKNKDASLTLSDIYKDPFIQLILKGKKMPSYATFEKRMSGIPGFQAGRPKAK